MEEQTPLNQRVYSNYSVISPGGGEGRRFPYMETEGFSELEGVEDGAEG